MSQIPIPFASMFKFTFQVPYIAKMAGESEDYPLSETGIPFPESALLPCFCSSEDRPFADVYLGWNEKGIGCQIIVNLAKKLPSFQAAESGKMGNRTTLWLDTRGDRSGHRATRTCRKIRLQYKISRAELNNYSPTVSRKKSKNWTPIEVLPIPRALQEPKLPNIETISLGTSVQDSQYHVNIFIGKEALIGYDPLENPLLGFYYEIIDEFLGNQTPTVGEEFPYDHDPHFWVNLELLPSTAPPSKELSDSSEQKSRKKNNSKSYSSQEAGDENAKPRKSQKPKRNSRSA